MSNGKKMNLAETEIFKQNALYSINLFEEIINYNNLNKKTEQNEEDKKQSYKEILLGINKYFVKNFKETISVRKDKLKQSPSSPW